MAEMTLAHRSPIGLYRPGLTPPDRLEKTTIGREEMLRDLLEKLGRSTGKKTRQHFVFIGPRGVGKTHLLSLLAYRIEATPQLRDHFTVVRFAEETHRLLSFADFLLRICEILAQSGGERWRQLYAELAEHSDDQRIIDTLQPILDGYRKDTGRVLLVLLENLDEVLTRQIKDERDIHRLRKFLMTSPSCVLVATAPITFPGLTDAKAPLYDFFDIQVIENLSRQQTVDAIRANLEYDDRKDLLARFDELSPKIKALHEMTGGNPRLVMMHYSLIADEDVLEVKRQFEELLDRISPFYQDRIKDLPPQERAVLETMALLRTQPKTPALIARKLRMSPQQTSSLLKRLTRSGYLVVMDNPQDKRSKIYRIKEGFFDLWLSMNESRQQRSRLPALVQFFDWWYEREEREQKRRALVDRLLAGDASPADVERHLVTLDHLSDAGADEERIEAKARAAAAMQQAGRAADSSKYLDEVNALKPGGVMQWLTLHRELWAETSRWPDPIAQVEKMIACWELQRAGQLEEFSARLLKVGLSLQGKGLHAALADLLLSSAQGLEDPRAKFHFLLQAAGSQEMSGDWRAALGSLATARGLAVGAKDRGLEGAALNNIGGIYRACGDYGRALECFEQSLAICREVGDRVVEGATLSNIGGIHLARGDYGRALDCLERSLATHRGIGHRVGEGVALNNISQVYHARGDYGRALKHLDLSLRIRREIGDRAGEGATLNNIGMVYDARKDHERALEYWQESLAICREIGDRAGEATVLSNIGSVYFARRDFARAAEYLGQSLATTREIGDRADLCRGLFNLGRIQAAGRDARSATSSWLAAFRIASGIGLSEALHSLEDLAKELGHPEGLAFWESLLEKGEAKESDVLAAAPHPLPLSQRERGEPGPHPNPLPEGEGTQEPSP